MLNLSIDNRNRGQYINVADNIGVVCRCWCHDNGTIKVEYVRYGIYGETLIEAIQLVTQSRQTT